MVVVSKYERMRWSNQETQMKQLAHCRDILPRGILPHGILPRGLEGCHSRLVGCHGS